MTIVRFLLWTAMAIAVLSLMGMGGLFFQAVHVGMMTQEVDHLMVHLLRVSAVATMVAVLAYAVDEWLRRRK